MKAFTTFCFLASLALCATAAGAAQTGERHGGWAIIRQADAFEKHQNAGTELQSVAKDGAQLNIDCGDQRGLWLDMSLKGLKADSSVLKTRRAKVFIKIDDRPAMPATGEILVRDAIELTFEGSAARYFAGAHRIGIRVKDEWANKDRDEFFSLPPMDKATRAIFEAGCRVL
jgi:hypothetical protein